MPNLKVTCAQQARDQLITKILCKAKGLPEWKKALCYTKKELENMPIGSLEQLFHKVSQEAKQ